MAIFELHHGDALDVLRGMPDNSVNCCVTSPPYYGLRDYGVDGQIGLEETPEAYIARLVDVFREVRRVLTDDGTLWVNIGDSYAGGGTIGRNDTDTKSLARRAEKYGTGQQAGSFVGAHGTRPKVDGLKQKDLIGIPWMLAFALRADGWYLRSEIIWHKPNPMPESVKDRPTKAHEQIFLLSKSPKYFYDAGAVLEPFTDKRNGNPGAFKWSYGGDTDKVSGKTTRGVGGTSHKLQTEGWNSDGSITGRNRRSVWTVTSKPYKEAHFATFPPDLIKPCILAGCPEGGTVLDPFGGSGTTAQVAIENGRNATLIELNPAYIELMRKRLTGIATRPANVRALLAVCEVAA
jgi:DNA modification methylase